MKIFNKIITSITLLSLDNRFNIFDKETKKMYVELSPKQRHVVRKCLDQEMTENSFIMIQKYIITKYNEKHHITHITSQQT